MENVIPFPIQEIGSFPSVIRKVIAIYKEAGLSDASIEAAIDELKPVLEPLILGRIEFVFEIPSEWALTPEQVELVGAAHDRCMKEAIKIINSQTEIAITTIIGLIGRKYVT